MDINLTIDLLEPDIKKLEEQEEYLVKALALVRKAKRFFFGVEELVNNQPVVEYSKPLLLVDIESLKGHNIKRVNPNYLGSILETLKESNSDLTAPAIMKIMFETKNHNGIKDLKKYKESVFPVFTRAYKSGLLLRDENTGFVSIGK